VRLTLCVLQVKLIGN